MRQGVCDCSVIPLDHSHGTVTGSCCGKTRKGCYAGVAEAPAFNSGVRLTLQILIYHGMGPNCTSNLLQQSTTNTARLRWPPHMPPICHSSPHVPACNRPYFESAPSTSCR